MFNKLKDVIMGKTDIHTFAQLSIAKEHVEEQTDDSKLEEKDCDGWTNKKEPTNE